MNREEFDKVLIPILPWIDNITRKYAAYYNRLEEWEDIRQTALLKMLRLCDNYDPGKGELLPWTCVVILRIIYNTARIGGTVSLDAVDERYIHSCSDNNPEKILQAAFIMQNLNTEARLYVEGYSYREIAAMQGLRSRSTVFNRVAKCTDKIRRLLGENHKQAPRPKAQRPAPQRPAQKQ
ncbi:MAG: sigma-70 family RNA polymerase sigma factor [Muribaculaceae bacterium]|nr:sigma-70 family RNA polymerase sigma factor [Muribaculaceae bacterium]